MALTWSTSARLTLSSAVISSMPISFACWFYPTAFTNFPALQTIENATATDYLCTYLGTGGNLVSESQASSVAVNASTANSSVTLNAWNHAVSVFASTTSRTIYLNGSTTATNTTSNSPASLSFTVLGGLGPDTARDEFFLGNLAFMSYWSAALTAADALSLYAGPGPRKVRPDALISYPMLRGTSPEPDYKGQSWTVFGSLPVVANPAIFAP